MSKKSHHFLTLWPWPLIYDLEKLIRSGHYHYQCVYQIWEQSIPWFLSHRVNTIAGGGQLRLKTITSPDPSDTGDIIMITLAVRQRVTQKRDYVVDKSLLYHLITVDIKTDDVIHRKIASQSHDYGIIQSAPIITWPIFLNSLRPRRNRRHFADAIFKCIFLNENEWISLRFSLKFVNRVRINNIPSLVQIMTWRRPGDKPLSEPIMVSLLMHICVTRPQWVKILVMMSYRMFLIFQFCFRFGCCLYICHCCVNSLGAKFFRKKQKHVFTILIIPPNWHDTGC